MRRYLHITLATAFVLAILPATALANVNLSFQVQNERGIPQVAHWSGSNGDGGRTDGFGKTTINVSPGETVSFTRFYINQCGGVPEGQPGVGFTVPNNATDGSTETITLPNTTGPAYHPELSDVERGLVGRINQDRAAHGLQPLVISTTLNAAADATARQSALQSAQFGSYPFPPQYCSIIPADWGWPILGGYGSDDAGTTDPNAAIAHWTDGSQREQAILAPFFNTIGIGDGDGSFIVDMSYCAPSDPAAARCGLTSDQGDASKLPVQTAGGSNTSGGGSNTSGGGSNTSVGGSQTGGGSKSGGRSVTAHSYQGGQTCTKASAAANKTKKHRHKGRKHATSKCSKPKPHKKKSHHHKKQPGKKRRLDAVTLGWL